MIKYVKCPTCEKQVEWSEKSPYRPFCSERCRLIDLGAWAAEEHRIAGETPADFPEDLPSQPRSDKTYS